MSWAAFVLKEDRAASKSSLLLLGTIPPLPAVAMTQVSTEAAYLIAVNCNWPSEPQAKTYVDCCNFSAHRSGVVPSSNTVRSSMELYSTSLTCVRNTGTLPESK
jgi:hypothetical protein